MSRKAILAIACLALAAALFFIGRPRTSLAPTQQSEPSRETPSTASSFPEPPITILPIATGIPPLNSPASSAKDDLATIDLLLSEFRRQSGGNPVGENEEITAALLGKNPKRLAYLSSQEKSVNSVGQLVDRWGSAYFFHQISGTQTEIRSAGPDRELYSADDLVR